MAPVQDQLSRDVLLLLRSFLIPEDRFYRYFLLLLSSSEFLSYFRQSENQQGWRNFLSTHNSYSWKVLRKETSIWNLNRRYSYKFFVDEHFKSRVLHLMLNPSIQLDLFPAFINQTDPIIDVFCNFHAITITGNRHATYPLLIENVKKVMISQSYSKELHLGNGIEKLYLSECNNVQQIITESKPREMIFRYNTRLAQFFTFEFV
jgi:hypothetical protein